MAREMAQLRAAQAEVRGLRRELRKVRERSTELEDLLASALSSKAVLETTLNEARRRTVPFVQGGGSVNFLPFGVVSIGRKQPVEVHRSWTGQNVAVHGQAEVTILCIGDVVEHFEEKKGNRG